MNTNVSLFRSAVTGALLACGLLATQVSASTNFVTSLTPNDSADWGALGGSFTSVGSSSTLNSTGGITLTVTGSGQGNFYRLDQSNGWTGNFTTGDALLWNTGSAGDLIVDFSSGIYGAGAQFQSDYYGGFTGSISAFDSSLSLLGTFSFSGTSNNNSDGSAVFAGIYDDSGLISRIVFSQTNGAFGENDFAVNSLKLVTKGNNRVPDSTATLPLLGIAMLGLGFLRRKFVRAA